jgi:hypothetical protein
MIETKVRRTARATEQKIAVREVDRFRHALGPFVVAAQVTRMAMTFTNASEPGNPIIFANDSFLALTGFAWRGSRRPVVQFPHGARGRPGLGCPDRGPIRRGPRVGVRNITNKQPPINPDGGYLGSLYNPYGRYW